MSPALGVGDEAGVAEALGRVEQGELGPGVGTLPPHDQPGVLRPGGKRDQVGQFGHPGTVADRAVGLSWPGSSPPLGRGPGRHELPGRWGIRWRSRSWQPRWRPRTRGWPRPSRPAPGSGGRRGPDGRQRSGRSGTPRAVPTGPGRGVRCGRRRRWPRRSPDAAWRPAAHRSCRTTRPTGRTRSPSCRWGWRPASPSRS